MQEPVVIKLGTQLSCTNLGSKRRLTEVNDTFHADIRDEVSACTISIILLKHMHE